MKTGMLSLFAAAALFTGVSVSNAAEPFTLTSAQLDSVSAGGRHNGPPPPPPPCGCTTINISTTVNVYGGTFYISGNGSLVQINL